MADSTFPSAQRWRKPGLSRWRPEAGAAAFDGVGTSERHELSAFRCRPDKRQADGAVKFRVGTTAITVSSQNSPLLSTSDRPTSAAQSLVTNISSSRYLYDYTGRNTRRASLLQSDLASVYRLTDLSRGRISYFCQQNTCKNDIIIINY